MTTKTVTILLVVLLYIEPDLVNACTCSPFFRHPQELVCLADFAFIGKVLKEDKILGQQPDPNDNFTKYKYTIRLTHPPIKGTRGHVGSNVVVETSGNGGLCYRRLQVGETLFLSGKENSGVKTVLSCDLILNIASEIPAEQKNYFFTTGRYSYTKNCKPKGYPTNTSPIGCEVPTDGKKRECYYKRALCQKRKRKWSWISAEKC